MDPTLPAQAERHRILLDLLAHPDVTVEVGTATLPVRARVADPDERAAIYARQREHMSNFADYEKSAAPRMIPVVLLDPA